jgi:hypothetical protein
MRQRTLRGYNGILRVGDDRVTIRRGLRGTLVRKRRDADVTVPLDQIAAVRFAPAGRVVGYLQIIERGASGDPGDYLATIRDRRAVTFFTRSGRWRRAAEEIAGLSGAPVEAISAAPYWNTVFGTVGSRRHRSR